MKKLFKFLEIYDEDDRDLSDLMRGEEVPPGFMFILITVLMACLACFGLGLGVGYILFVN
jgi:hypothetical protein